MAVLNILVYPDSRLRTVASAVDQVDNNLRMLIDDMLETMYAAPGIGLAATQVNVHKRLLVIDVSDDHSEPHTFINPRILHREGEGEMQEGCLSVPGYFETVRRAEKITVSALNCNGSEFTLDADGLFAVCIQHEIDHLDGKVFIDYLSTLKRDRIRKQLLKEQRGA